MAEKCSKNWDAFCEFRSQDPELSYPNQLLNCSSSPVGFTAGQQLLHNAAQRRFCKPYGCTPRVEKFNPNVADSPNIVTYPGCAWECEVDPATIDNDYVMDLCLKDPAPVLDVLTNIITTSKRKGIDIKGTKIGKLSDAYYNTK